MRFNQPKSLLKQAVFALGVLLLGAGISSAQTVNLTAAPTTATMPDGNSVPMWGYSCTTAATAAACATTNPIANGMWSPVIITTAPGNLTINLTNSLPSGVPTSLTIVGQLGGGLGATAKTVPSPAHVGQTSTWPIVGNGAYIPPSQPDRVQSFATEVATGATTTLNWSGLKPGTYLIESGTHPSIQGPMGLYGILVVTTAPIGTTPGTAYPAGTKSPAVTYDADLPLLLSEIDPAQNAAVAQAVATPGFSETATANLTASGPIASISVTNGGSGYTSAPTVTLTGASTPAGAATAVITLDTVKSITVSNGGSNYSSAPTVHINGGGGSGATATAVMAGTGINKHIASITVTQGGSGYTSVPTISFTGGGGHNASASAVVAGFVSAINVTTAGNYNSAPTISLSGGGGAAATAELVLKNLGLATCFAAHTCYPPAVNYDPRYYLVNGISFDNTAPTLSQFKLFQNGLPTAVTGNVLVRFVNAGLRMHVPSIVGAQVQSAGKVVPGFALIAEDGNVLPGAPRIQNEVFLAAGKVYDVMISPSLAAGAYTDATFPVFDRQLSLSTNNARDGGMHAYIQLGKGSGTVGQGTAAPSVASLPPANYFCTPGVTLSISDPSKGVLAGLGSGAYGAQLSSATSAHGTIMLNPDGTFTYTQAAGATACGDSFIYNLNGNNANQATVSIAQCLTTNAACFSGSPTALGNTYMSAIASKFQLGAPGLLLNATDPGGHLLKASISGSASGGTVVVNADGSFTAIPAAVPSGNTTATVTFQYLATNSQNAASTPATVSVIFQGGTGLSVNVFDAPVGKVGVSGKPMTDYRWIIEEDRTFHVDPNVVNNGTSTVPSLGTNFHTSYMPVIAAGCVGVYACESGQTVFDPNTNAHLPAVCDVGDGACRTVTDPNAAQQTPVDPSQVHLDPTKHYYISILPGDAGNSFTSGSGAPVTNPDGTTRQFNIAQDCGDYDPGSSGWAPGSGVCGHSMGGAPIGPGATSINVLLQETPFQPAKVSVFVYEDDYPLNGENDAGGGVDVLAPIEPGLGGFQIRMFDDAGGTGDATGQITYDMFNMPISNSLAGTIDPTTKQDACPISPTSSDGLVGMVVTCPKYEADGKTLSPLAGQAVIANLYPGRYGIVANPGADRISKGEEWLQTNTLDGQKAHDSFIKVGGPAYFQEFGPAGFHVSIGFANPAIINARLAPECAAAKTTNPSDCNNTVTGTVTEMRQSHPPDQRLYGSGTHDALGFTQCYVSLGDPDGADIAFTKCDANGTFTLSGIPNGNWRITVFDQWNDQIVDGLSTPVSLTGSGYTFTQLPVQQWHTNVATTTFFDQNGDGVRNDNEPGLALVATNIRFRDGSYSNFNSTDLNGYATFNELFPLFNWYVIETDTTRYKPTGVHVVYDGGGPADGTPGGATSDIAANLASTIEANPLPTALRFPGSVYCADADCKGDTLLNNPTGGGAGGSTGRIDPGWVATEGWQGFIGQYQFMEFGEKPFAPGENGGIKGEVIYASTRPFDDPAMLIHTSWTPDVPGVTINLYQEGTASDGTTSLKLVDTTVTSSWDAWAQGFRSDGMPNMSCPGQGPAASDLFFYTLKDTTNWLDTSNRALPNDSQFKCYDGLHNFNQVQPAPYDGMYNFPSVISRDTKTGRPTGTNCTICVDNPTGDGTKMLPDGKYVVEMIVPPNYELVKEEDKNILIGDNYIAPVTQQFGGLGNIFILPDQAEVNGQYNASNPQNPTNNLGSTPRTEGDTGSIEEKWPCVGAARVVPDYISLFPYSQEVSPFAGATRNLCDRKEIVLEDQRSVNAKFWVFSSTHVAAHFTGFILDDLSSEFDPFSPQFGEKFAVPNLPISIKDFAGNEVLRTYADQWGVYNGLNYSTWEVNPPNPTGYAPTMMVACMNDPGNAPTPDPNFNPAYSQFCYEIPYMPGQTQYMDTPVIPTAAFAEGYNPADCAYPDTTPAVSEVDGDGVGPWVSAVGNALTIRALGSTQVPNPAYSGPQATTAPFNQKFLTRKYSFGSTAGTVTIGGVNAPVTSWSDTQIKVTVPSNVPSCAANGPLQRNGTLGATYAAQCGQLVVSAANGKSSIDAVTVTVGGKAPVRVNAENNTNNAVQLAIDGAKPGDLIMVGPGVYNEMLLMWKPVRLQGVGAASSVINANTHPSGKMDPWRRQVNCLFGLATNGSLLSSGNVYDPTGIYSAVCPTGSTNDPLVQRGKVDPLPLEGIVGWDTTLNGNLAELLQEPSLMGAYEGAAITVLGKGMNLSIDGTGGGAAGTEGDFPANARVLTNSNADCNAFPSNFLCNPSRIDGLTLSNSSQGGGGIYVHAWNHYLEIANNRVYGNAGTLSGGITVGQGESPDGAFNAAGVELPFLYDQNVNVHNNSITANSSYGDELFSASPSAAGGVTFCTGADYYHFNYNWVCGNLSTGDGGGLDHQGFIYNGDISHNWILFNQSNNISIPTNGGGIAVLGAAPDGTPAGAAAGTECGSVTDIDCAPGLSDGIGPGLMINANVIMGNTAESGSGGGIRLQTVNGTEVTRFPLNPAQWYEVDVFNNIIANNVAGWDGGGVSLQDALKVKFINNTVASNDTTASSGVLFNTIGAPQASTPPPGCDPVQNPTCIGEAVDTSTIQAAGLVTMQNTSNLTSALPGTIICPAGNGGGTSQLPVPNGACRSISYPLIENDLFWQNRTFNIQVGGSGTGLQSQQNIVTLVPTLNQAATGQCVSGAGYWDIGVRGDGGPTSHTSGFTLNPSYSILTKTTGYASTNKTVDSDLVSPYCNGSRVPPENGGMGYNVPPGIADATVPNPTFNLTPAATVDEGNNWINMTYGPLTLPNPTLTPGLAGYGNYELTAGSGAINGVPRTGGGLFMNPAYADAPSVDFFGTPRKTNGAVDIGAVEYVGPAVAIASVTPGPLAFGNVAVGTTSATQTLTLSNTGAATLTGINPTFTGPFARAAAGGTCGTTLAAGTTCTISVVFQPTASGPATGSLTIGANVAVTNSPVSLSGTGFVPVLPVLTSIQPASGTHGTLFNPAQVAVTLNGSHLTGTTSVNISGLLVGVSNVVVVSDTKVTATFTIPLLAPRTARTVTVTTPSGMSNSVTFTVN